MIPPSNNLIIYLIIFIVVFYKITSIRKKYKKSITKLYKNYNFPIAFNYKTCFNQMENMCKIDLLYRKRKPPWKLIGVLFCIVLIYLNCLMI